MNLEHIQRKIYEIRGLKVILDFDLAYMYDVETRVLNQAVKRNPKRFPPDFMFQLTDEEFTNLKSQFVTSSWGGTRKLPYAFTEQGVAMLSGLLNSDIAIYTNIAVMRAFVMIRQYALNYAELDQKIEKITARLDDNDVKTNEIFKLLKKNEKYGVIDLDGEAVIPFVFDSMWDFCQGEKLFLSVNKNEKYGVIDFQGKTILPFEYDNMIS